MHNIDHSILLNFIKVLSQFGEIPETKIKSLAKLVTKTTYKKNEFFSTPENKSEYLAFIMTGLFRLYIVDKEEKEITVSFKGENSFMSSYATIFQDQVPPRYIQALEESEVYAIPMVEFIKIWEKDSVWKNIIQNITEFEFMQSRKREQSFRLHDAKTRYLNFLEDYPQYADRIQLQYIASFLDISPETLSRIRSSPIKN